jgi:hypothetical protein
MTTRSLHPLKSLLLRCEKMYDAFPKRMIKPSAPAGQEQVPSYALP